MNNEEDRVKLRKMKILKNSLNRMNQILGANHSAEPNNCDISSVPNFSFDSQEPDSRSVIVSIWNFIKIELY